MSKKENRVLGLLKRVTGWGGGSAEQGELTSRFKAQIAGQGMELNSIGLGEDQLSNFAEHGALEPPLPFDRLCVLLLSSNSLRQNVDGYVTNIDSFGWEAEPTIDLTGPNAKKNVESLLAMQTGEDPDEATVEAKLAEWKKEAAREKAKLTHFFEFINAEDTFTELRRKKRMDDEVLGNSAWEVLRNGANEPAVISYVPMLTIRLMPIDEFSTPYTVSAKTDPVTVSKKELRKRFRRYVQIQEGTKAVWFKEYGDPRLMSARTGNRFPSEAKMKKAEGADARAATEIFHFKIHSPNQAYGVPRWIGNLLSVMGSRMAEEVNFLYFENKSVPPMAIIFSGGRLAKDSVTRIESFVQNHIKGKENFHKILILEAEPEGDDSKNTGRGQIKLQPLTSAQHGDGLFQKYDKNNIDKVGASFRQPRIMRGDMEGVTKSGAETAQRLAEEQVYQPERDLFDAVMNRRFLPPLGIRFWKFRSLPPKRRDPAVVAEIMSKLMTAGALMPDEARDLLPEVLGGVKLRDRDDDFLRMPMKLAITAARARGAMPDLSEDGNVAGDTSANDPGAKVTGESKSGGGRDEMLELIADDLVQIKAKVRSKELEEEILRLPKADFDAMTKLAPADNGKP
jgi:PBSX family phage portal protein